MSLDLSLSFTVTRVLISCPRATKLTSHYSPANNSPKLRLFSPKIQLINFSSFSKGRERFFSRIEITSQIYWASKLLIFQWPVRRFYFSNSWWKLIRKIGPTMRLYSRKRTFWIPDGRVLFVPKQTNGPGGFANWIIEAEKWKNACKTTQSPVGEKKK